MMRDNLLTNTTPPSLFLCAPNYPPHFLLYANGEGTELRSIRTTLAVAPFQPLLVPIRNRFEAHPVLHPTHDRQ